MLTKEQIQAYAPHNGKSLTQEELQAMQGFSDDEIKQLADAHPNNPNGNNYLILGDTGSKKQLHPTSTWANLLSLRRAGQKQYVVISYRSIFREGSESAKLKVAKPQDLSAAEAKKELKTAGTQNLSVVKDDDKELTAEQIAAKEAGELDGPQEKDLRKMDKKELQAKYREVFEEDADPKLSVAKLITAIEDELEEQGEDDDD